jgi:hypothetical protein
MKLIQNKWLLFIKRIAEEDLKSFDSIEDFWKSLEISLSATKIFDIHQRSKVVLTYPDGIKMNSILVGGLSLSRGFTVEGLITSVFIRTTKTFDALMQMGRWFGHKKHILKYITVYTTPTIRNRFELIEESIVDLLDQIDEMKRLQLPPTEFGLNIRRHPNVVIEAAVKELRSRQGLDIVSRAKRKHAKEITLKLSLGDRIMETVRFLKDVQSVEFNNELVNKLFINLENEPNCNKYHPEVFPGLTVDIQDKSKIIGFIDVPNEHVKDFISNFKLPPQRLSETNAKLPLRFLLDFIDNPENISLKWDISLVTGEQDSTKILDREFNKVKRSFELSKDGKYLKLPKNQLSIPAHEFRFLLETYTSMIDRKKARIDRNSQTGKPLLLIYPIKPVEAKGVKLDLDMFDDKCLWGWSISMPGSGKDDDYISVLANSVLLKQLMEDYDQDLELEEYEDN